MSLREMYALAITIERTTALEQVAEFWAAVATALAWAISRTEGRHVGYIGQPVNPLVRAPLGRL